MHDSFLSISLIFQPKFVLTSGTKRERTETQKCDVQNGLSLWLTTFLTNTTYFTEVLGHQTFLTVANNGQLYTIAANGTVQPSTIADLFIARWLWTDDTMLSQSIHLLLSSDHVGLLAVGMSTMQTDFVLFSSRNS